MTNWQYLQSDAYHIDGLSQLRMVRALCKLFTDPDPKGANGNAPFEKEGDKEENSHEEMHFLGIFK